MNAWIRQTTDRLDSSYWFLPALMTIGAIGLAFVTYRMDVAFGSDFLVRMGWVHSAKPDGARALLSAISGSMISVAGTVFAITIAAVVYASGSYGPRLLTNFMTDRGNQLTLGVFIATFVYCLLILRTIRQPDEMPTFPSGSVDGGFVPEISLLVALGLALLSVAVLVYFLHHVPDSIRINHVVASVGERAMKGIARRFPESDQNSMFPAAPTGESIAVRAVRVGYIEVIDFATLADVTRDQGIQVVLTVRPGDFIHPDMTIMKVHGAMDEEVDERLRSAFATGEARTPGQDIDYLFDELAEIALRALSPAVNDPFTAITCLHWIAAATASLAKRDLGCDADGGDYGEHGVFAVRDDFAHFVTRGFGTVRASAASSPLTSQVFVDALESASAGHPNADRCACLKDEARLLLAQAEGAMHGPALDTLRARVARFID